MHVKVVFYGGLKRDVGVKEQELHMEQETLTISQLMDQLIGQYPQLRSKLSSVVYAVGDEIVAEDHPIADGDEVALLPPVSGG